MPRHDRHDDDIMSRERSYSDRSDRDYHDYEDRDRGAFFDSDRGGRSDRRRIGGWGGLMGREDRERSRDSASRGRSEPRGEQSYGPDDYRSGIPTDETERLIASNKVEGTPVYDRNGDRLGSVHNFMVDKFRGKVVYAVLKHSSGFLGFDERYYPLEWEQLTYDTRLGGYHIDLTEDDLKGFGSWDRSERWQDRRSGRRPERARFERDREREIGGGRFERERGFGRNRELELSRDVDRFDRTSGYDRGPMREPW